MGCDIHIHAEIKVRGKWHHYDQPDCDRNYLLFEKMAGVRGEVSNAISAPRGLPENATFTTKFDAKHWGSDGHSHSWLSSKEVGQLATWWEANGNGGLFARWDQWLFGNPYSGWTKYPQDRPKGLDDFRFIFWFDN